MDANWVEKNKPLINITQAMSNFFSVHLDSASPATFMTGVLTNNLPENTKETSSGDKLLVNIGGAPYYSNPDLVVDDQSDADWPEQCSQTIDSHWFDSLKLIL